MNNKNIFFIIIILECHTLWNWLTIFLFLVQKSIIDTFK